MAVPGVVHVGAAREFAAVAVRQNAPAITISLIKEITP
jgi:hypothetical protein